MKIEAGNVRESLPGKNLEIHPEIKLTLENHIVDHVPGQIGQRELIKSISGASLGAREVYVDRPDPPLKIESAMLERGTSKVIIGPNGAGKSTAFDAFMERGAALDTHAGKGAAVFGKPVHAREKLRIARLDQEEMLEKIGEFPAGKVLRQAADYFKSQFPVNWDSYERYEQNLENEEVHRRIDALMDKIVSLFEMNGFLGTNVENLSGGERTKLALFMVLLSEADILLLDEPTNHLDLESISKLTALFNEYKKIGVSILSASHVDWFLKDAGKDGVLEIDWNRAGRTLKESGSTYERYMKNPTREKVPIISGDIYWPQNKYYGYKMGETLVASPEEFTIPQSPLKKVSIPNIHGGELIVTSGNNGSGKTKLMQTVVESRDKQLPRRQKGVNIAYLPQFWPEKVAKGTLREFFEWVRENTNPHAAGSSRYVNQPPHQLFIDLAKELSFGGKSNIGESWLNRPFHKFSGGEQRLLWFLAAASIQSVDMLVLDEPTNHMDRTLQEKVARAIQDFSGAIMLSTHDRNLISALTKGGKVQGMMRRPIHLTLEKSQGTTKITKSEKNPLEYMEALMKEAQKKAKQFRV